MASEVAICNMALSLIGADGVVASISPPDGSAEAGHCKRFYPIARREVLEMADWSCAITRVALAEITNTSDTWAYAYQLPSDCIKPLRVLPAGEANPQMLFLLDRVELLQGDEHESASFTIEGQALRTHVAEATLVYKREITDTSTYSQRMTSAIAMTLAGYLAGPIIKGLEGAKVGIQWLEAGRKAALGAAAQDGQSKHDGMGFVPASIQARA